MKDEGGIKDVNHNLWLKKCFFYSEIFDIAQSAVAMNFPLQLNEMKIKEYVLSWGDVMREKSYNLFWPWKV
jgi:hypothetical protein